jgi:hypothetical protein
MEQLEATTCTNWPANPTFDPKRVLLHRLFFIKEDRTKYKSVVFCPARDYQPLVEFGVVRRGGGTKTIILNDKHVYVLAESLAKLLDAVCSGGDHVIGSECKNGTFRLNVTRGCRTTRLYSDSQYISLTLPDIDYLSRMFNVVQQQLQYYIVAMPDLYVTTALTSVTYVEPEPKTSKHFNYPHLYEELITFV